jgi:SpoVK/Ycf46/Vps4 family AAA+-type ATPase
MKQQAKICENINFKFSYIDSMRIDDDNDIIEHCEQPLRNCGNGTIHTVKDYEINLFMKYVYLTLKKQYKERSESKIDRDYGYGVRFLDFINILERLKKQIEKNNIFKKFSLKNMCDEFTKDKFIQCQLKKFKEDMGYYSIERKTFLNNDNTIVIFDKYMAYIIEDLEKYFNDLDFNKLEACFYTKQFNEYCNLINLQKESNIYEFIRWHFYNNVNLFYKYRLYKYPYFLDKSPMLGELKKYEGFIVDFVRDSISIDDVYLSPSFLTTCFYEYDSKNDFINTILHKVSKTNLTHKAFEYVPEYNYIKNILKEALKTKQKGINILLYGKPGTGKTEMAKTLIKETKANGYDISDNNKTLYKSFRSDTNDKNAQFFAIKYMLKNSSNNVILYDEAEDFFRLKDITDRAKSSVNEILEDNETPIIWTTNSLDNLEQSYFRRFTYVCNIDFMSKNIYLKIYKNILKNYRLKFNKKLFDLCFENKVSLGILKKVFNNAKLTNNQNIDLIIQDLKNTFKSQKIIFKEQKSDIKRYKEFDPALLNTSDNLNEFCKKMQKNKRLDFSLLLHGVSGSGKSYFAEYLAKQLELPIIKKKASDLESCWVGVTEQNIAEAFKEAREEKALLIIDEGDHFISDRTKHMRSWETSRTEEMLQQLEAHPYPVVFTTNLMENIDKAAIRRFTYKIKFDYLTLNQVIIAWKDYFPNAKLPKEIHLSRLCPGDFATVYKKAEFENYLTDTALLYKKLEEEMENKKEMENSSIRF